MELIAALRRALADVFVMATHVHIGHWNVVSCSFSEHHAFLGKLYDDLEGEVDDVAEHIRALGEMAPGTLGALILPSALVDQDAGSEWPAIVTLARDENDAVLESLRAAADAAVAANEQGVLNYLADRIDRHAKWGWMLNAYVAAAQMEMAEDAMEMSSARRVRG